MVQLRYKGTNYILFGNVKIVRGNNEIDDEVFWKLMKTKLFAARVKSGVFDVDKNFPLEKPKSEKKPSSAPTSEEIEPTEDAGEEDEKVNNSHRLSSKQTLRTIHDSEDAEFLQNLIDNDDRSAVKTAAQKRLDYLESEKK